jgi:putative PIN family toxin of toxin-antitoxin system
MRVVIDTNVLVSALLSPRGACSTIISLTRAGRFTAYVSPAVYEEYLDVLFRPKFKQSYEQRREFLAGFYVAELFVFPTSVARVCTDPEDDIFVACAEAACADFLITGNARHFPEHYGITEIIRPIDFLRRIET